MILYSIVICTCNPVQETLEQVLVSCTDQSFDRQQYEILVIDNNSTNPLSGILFIKELTSAGKIKLLEEKKQGLAYARITGAKAARGGTFVFVDDDNILDPHYLKNLSQLQSEFPQVGAWGPGQITIDYKGDVDEWVKTHYAWLFQQKNMTTTQTGSIAGWPDYYPAGSGLSVIRTVMETYIKEFENGTLTLTGRKGKVLSSAEDTQIVWTGIKMNLSAGTSPLLKLKHVIPSSRTSLNYLKQLNYGIAYSYARALKEMFPEKLPDLKKRSFAGKLNFMVKMLFKARFNLLFFYRFYSIENSWYRAIEHSQSFSNTR